MRKLRRPYSIKALLIVSLVEEQLDGVIAIGGEVIVGKGLDFMEIVAEP